MKEGNKLQSRLVVIWVAVLLFIFFYLYLAFLVWDVSNIWKKIKCPTLPIDEEYEWVIKAEYKSLVLIDWTYSHIDWNEVYDWCYRDAWLEDNSLVCPNWYNSWARIEEKWEWVLDMKEDNCYYADSDVSMLKAIYEEKHNKD